MTTPSRLHDSRAREDPQREQAAQRHYENRNPSGQPWADLPPAVRIAWRALAESTRPTTAK